MTYFPSKNDVRSVLEVKNINKNFTGVKALQDVSLDLFPGEILIIVGENGAGKSTLMKIIAGAQIHDSGQIILDHEEVRFNSPSYAQEKGIKIVYQEQALIPDLNAVDNIFLGSEETGFLGKSIFGIRDTKKMKAEARKIIQDTFEMDIDLDKPISSLPMVQKQIVEIIRAIIKNTKVLILDEPTSALEEHERDLLFLFLRKLKKTGVGIIYCSHYIEECIDIGDRIIALRDGKKVGEKLKSDATVDNIVELMIGKKISEQYPKLKVPVSDDFIFKVENLNRNREFEKINLEIKSGEIIGIGGLAGCGKFPLARTMFGLLKPDSGSLSINNIKFKNGYSTQETIKNRIAFIPADRKNEGLFLDQSLSYNTTIANLGEVMNPWIISEKEKQAARHYIDSLNIKTAGVDVECRTLSGGNQQKVMISRWLFNNPRLLIFEEPTRGIDVNAKVDVYRLINKFLTEGGSVIIISSEVPELEGMCDRVYVMHNGKISAELAGSELNKENIAYFSVTTGKRSS